MQNISLNSLDNHLKYLLSKLTPNDLAPKSRTTLTNKLSELFYIDSPYWKRAKCDWNSWIFLELFSFGDWEPTFVGMFCNKQDITVNVSRGISGSNFDGV